MKANYRHFIILFFLLFNSSIYLFAQEKNPNKWPYGGIPDSSRYNEFTIVVPLNFDKADFNEEQFDSKAIFRFSNFINSASFGGAHFQKYADFSYAHFFEKVDFQGAVFEEPVNWWHCESDKAFDCSDATFHSQSDFSRSIFHDVVYFNETNFKGNANLSLTKFHKPVYFGGAEFEEKSDFSHTEFLDEVDFSEGDFGRNVRFTETVNFEHTKFTKGVDFRRVRFDSVKFIYLYGFKFPEGKLWLYWDQINGKDNLRIKLSQLTHISDSVEAIRKKEQFQRIETIYHQLRDNFLAQSNKSSADDVMYELGWQRKEILGGFLWHLYGWIFGWGYQPVKFLIFVFFLAVIFSVIWYWKYYGIVALILNEEDRGKTVFKQIRSDKGRQFEKTIGIRGKGITLRFEVFDHSKISNHFSLLYRSWHVLFFSFSVLLGIRWKKEWSDVKYKGLYGSHSFLRVVTTEYILGLSLYIVFAVLVKSNQFAYIKGLLGF